MDNVDNMLLYNQVRNVPEEAQKTIGAGKLKGFTDINPMWRIKKLTEIFGVCGFGWTVDIIERWTDTIGSQSFVSVKVALKVKLNGQWSEPIIGVGGSMLYGKGVGTDTISDEAWKMAYTDAISIACKSLGFAADIYYAKDRTKYDVTAEPNQAPAVTLETLKTAIEQCTTPEQVAEVWHKNKGFFANEQLNEFRLLVAKKGKALKEGEIPPPPEGLF